MGSSCVGIVALVVMFATIVVSWVVIARDLMKLRRKRRMRQQGFEVQLKPDRPAASRFDSSEQDRTR